jgi:hypothetical protein
MPAKPPTQVAGVVGIESTPITMNTSQPAIDWGLIVTLPPFQMFASDRMRSSSSKDSEEHAREYVRAQGGGADLFQVYSLWHEASGYWPGEDALGRQRGA